MYVAQNAGDRATGSYGDVAYSFTAEMLRCALRVSRLGSVPLNLSYFEQAPCTLSASVSLGPCLSLSVALRASNCPALTPISKALLVTRWVTTIR